MINGIDMISELIGKGQIRLGMSRMELHELLGPPKEEGGASRKHKMSSIYKYGDIQFVFPQAATSMEQKLQGLCYVYVDDDVEGVEDPIFLLR